MTDLTDPKTVAEVLARVPIDPIERLSAELARRAEHLEQVSNADLASLCEAAFNLSQAKSSDHFAQMAEDIAVKMTSVFAGITKKVD